MSASAPAHAAETSLHDANFLGQVRRDMTRFAELQLRDRAAAEDAVQDALTEAMTGAHKFSGRSALKTWIYAILRHKIIDAMRRRSRTINASGLVGDAAGDHNADNSDDAGAIDALFDARGHWRNEDRPQTWEDPEASLAQQQFWRIFEACLDNLPPATARVFMMREHLGFDTDEICSELGIKTNNCWVILHRARTQLRICLEKNWFAGAKQPC